MYVSHLLPLHSPSLGGPHPLYKLPVDEEVDVTSEQTTSGPVARDPEHTANWMPTLDSAPSTLQTSVAMAPEVQTQTSYSPTNLPSTVSGRSDELLLPPSPPVAALQAYSPTSLHSTVSGESDDLLLPPSPPVPALQAHTSCSPTSLHSTVSGRSDELLLPPSPPVAASRPNLVYEQVDVQQTQVPPPAHDEHVQYAQLKHQDKM